MSNKANPKIRITYYTDPLCCWSWAMEPQWRLLRYLYKDQIEFVYRLGVLIRDWTAYNDPLNGIYKPIHMGPLWMEAEKISGIPLDHKIWYNNPPSSSVLPCLAIKAAEKQSKEAGERLMRALRKAVMLNGVNISDKPNIEETAEKLGLEGALTFQDWKKDFYSEEVADDLNSDLKEVNQKKVSRFPTFIFKHKDKAEGVLLTGYRPFEVLRKALVHLDPCIIPGTSNNLNDFRNQYSDLLQKEIAIAEEYFAEEEIMTAN